jgi:hypothetical protein
MLNICWRSFSSVLRKSENNHIQIIYETLAGIHDISKSSHDPVQCSNLLACMSAMNDVTLQELGLSKLYLEHLEESVCLDICTSRKFSIAVFIIPRGCRLPLHDHPNMCVLSKLIVGRLRYRSFTPIGYNTNLSTGTYQCVNEYKTFHDPTWALTRSVGNFHELIAEECCVLLDSILPPYHPPERSCIYYQANQLPSKEWILEATSEPEGLPYSVRYRGVKPNTSLSLWA